MFEFDLMSAYNCNKLSDIVCEKLSHTDIMLKYSAVLSAMVKIPLSYGQTVVFGQRRVDVWDDLGFTDEVLRVQILEVDSSIRRYVALSRLFKSFTLDFMINSSTDDKLMYCMDMLLAIDGIPEHLQSVRSSNTVLWSRFSALNNAVICSNRIEYQHIWNLVEYINECFNSISINGDWSEVQNEIDMSVSLLVIHLLIAALIKDKTANSDTELSMFDEALKSTLNLMF
jgi:hypothetical protein